MFLSSRDFPATFSLCRHLNYTQFHNINVSLGIAKNKFISHTPIDNLSIKGLPALFSAASHECLCGVVFLLGVCARSLIPLKHALGF